MSSLALQRWLTMWIVFILVWEAMFLIDLVSTEVSLVDIVQFVLTILIVPILLSAYGEVNYESKRMIRVRRRSLHVYMYLHVHVHLRVHGHVLSSPTRIVVCESLYLRERLYSCYVHAHTLVKALNVFFCN